jgi:hypothetical protein
MDLSIADQDFCDVNFDFHLQNAAESDSFYW